MNYNSTPQYREKLKNNRRKRRIKRALQKSFLIFIVLILLAVLIFFCVKFVKTLNSQKPDSHQSTVVREESSQQQVVSELTYWEKYDVSKISVPDYVDVQLIDIGKARTGMYLDNVKNIVVHYVGNPKTTAQNNHDYFAQETTGVCAHFVVGMNGEIIQCVPLNERSAASNHRNKDTISIEVCHPDKTGKFTKESFDSTVKLCSWLCRTFDLKSSDVIRHYDITGKECPKYYVKNPAEWRKFVEDVETTLKEPV